MHAQGEDSSHGAGGDRIIYGKDVAQESDEIQYKWNAIFYKCVSLCVCVRVCVYLPACLLCCCCCCCCLVVVF